MRSLITNQGFLASLLIGCGVAFLSGNALRAQETAKAVFSHPAAITHPYLPLASIRQEVFEGVEDGKKMRVTLTQKPTTKIFLIGGQQVAPLCIEDRETENGKIKEVTLDYFAQDDGGTVYYLGEQVDNYKNGKIVGHEGAWEYGKGQAALGVLLPADPKINLKFQSENVPGITTEDDEVVSTSEVVTVPMGKYKNCVKIREKASDGVVEYKVYAKGVGMVIDDKLKLVSRSMQKM